MRHFWVPFIVLLLTGCASDEAARYFVAEKYPARPADQVQVLTTVPTTKYVLIAELQARGMSVDSMRRWAAEIGADAVIINEIKANKSRDDMWASDNTDVGGRSRIIGSAIKYPQ